MKKAILAILGVIVAIIIVLCIVIAMRPADYTVTRSATFNAPPEVVFYHVNDFHMWSGWSPWAKIDPNMKVIFSGPQSGVGAAYAWQGNDDVGEGKMTITESRPNELVKIDLKFLKPFEADNVTQFDIKPSGSQTTLTWSMTGHNNFVTKAFTLFVDMDKMVGDDFEKGLANMKPIVEAARIPTPVEDPQK